MEPFFRKEPLTIFGKKHLEASIVDVNLLGNTPPTPAKNDKDLLSMKYFLLLYQTVKEVSISWKYAQKKILNLTLLIFTFFVFPTLDLFIFLTWQLSLYKLLWRNPINWLLYLVNADKNAKVKFKYQQFASVLFLSR